MMEDFDLNELDKLSNDDKIFLASSIKNYDVLEKLSQDSESTVRQCVAGNPNTPPQILTQLSRDSRYNVKWSVAGNTSTPAEVLTQLARDKDINIRINVAKNISTSYSDLLFLSKSDSLTRIIATENIKLNHQEKKYCLDCLEL